MKNLIPALICLFLAIPCQAMVIYVDDDADVGGDGLSWETAYKYLQDALYAPLAGDDQIWVAAGVYKPDQDESGNVTPGDRDETFQLISDVAIYGGFAGSETSLDERDWHLWETILSGDLDGNDGPDFINNGENSYHVVTCYYLSAITVLDGFTITGGNANIWFDPKHRGGGIFNFHSDTTIVNCTISNNYAISDSGGMYNAAEGGSTNPTLIGCIFTGNRTSGNGGGIHSYEGNPTLINCTFVYNHALHGAGMDNVTGNPMVINCIFWDNVPDGIYDPFDKAAVSYCDIQNGWPGIGNIDVDPCFADPCNGDYHLKSQAGRWNPNSESWVIDAYTSRCIDAGNPGSPLRDESNDGNNVRINMGAYGGTTEASKTPANWSLLADINNDGTVDFVDFAHFADIFTNQGNELPSDFDRDGYVDYADLFFLTEDWLKQTTWHE